MTYIPEIGTIIVMTLGGVRHHGYIKASRGSSSGVIFHDIQLFNGILHTNTIINEKFDWLQVYDPAKHG